MSAPRAESYWRQVYRKKEVHAIKSDPLFYTYNTGVYTHEFIGFLPIYSEGMSERMSLKCQNIPIQSFVHTPTDLHEVHGLLLPLLYRLSFVQTHVYLDKLDEIGDEETDVGA